MPGAKNLKNFVKVMMASAKPEYRGKIEEINNLWEQRKIPNYRTAYNAILDLASYKKIVLQKADKTYKDLMAKYEEKPSITGRFKNKTSVAKPVFNDVVGDWKMQKLTLTSTSLRITTMRRETSELHPTT